MIHTPQLRHRCAADALQFSVRSTPNLSGNQVPICITVRSKSTVPKRKIADTLHMEYKDHPTRADLDTMHRESLAWPWPCGRRGDKLSLWIEKGELVWWIQLWGKGSLYTRFGRGAS